jgi:DNA-binding transcriptional LysR family regulator
MKPDLNLLAVFDAVFRQGSVSRAADQLALSQPAVSHALARLRKQLGDPLFVRAGRGLTPTDQARALAPRIRILIGAAEALIQPEIFRPDSYAGTFRIAASDFAAMTLVPPLLASLRKAAPHVRVQILPVDRETTRRLELGELDFSFWGTGPPDPPFQFTRLFSESFVAVADQAHPILQLGNHRPTLDAVLAFPHAVISFGDPGRSPVDEALRRLGLSRQIGLITPGFASTIAALPGSDLIACLPTRLRDCLPANLRCFDLPLLVPSFDYGLLWHDNGGLQPRQIWLRSRAQDVLASVPDKVALR